MGSVIEKTAQILRLVTFQEHCTLKSLCAATGYKKSALCQMLRSMVETELLLRDHRGEYHTGPLFSDLTENREDKCRNQKLIESIAVDINTVCGANVTVATLRNGKYRRLFSCCSVRVTRLTATAPDEEHFYRNATGRVLLAHAPAELRLKIIDRLGLPDRDQWPEGAEDQESLLRELEKIRQANCAEVISEGGRNYYLASALRCTGDQLPVAIGIGTAPAEAKNREKFLGLLRKAAEKFNSPNQKE